MGLYRPGDQLPTERDLADIMGVSRTTVREAIRVLSAQGFLSVKRGRTGGTFICEALTLPSVRELKQKLEQRGTTLSEILDYRLVMEPGVAELAAQRANSQQLDELQSLVDRMKQAANHFNDHRHLDTKFHLLIASATQSRRLNNDRCRHSCRTLRFTSHHSSQSCCLREFHCTTSANSRCPS
jgi:DNA-binding FadR family transcriptional regulator